MTTNIFNIGTLNLVNSTLNLPTTTTTSNYSRKVLSVLPERCTIVHSTGATWYNNESCKGSWYKMKKDGTPSKFSCRAMPKGANPFWNLHAVEMYE